MGLDGFGIRASEEEAREWAGYFVVHRSTKSQKLHLPAPQSTCEDPLPYCRLNEKLPQSEFMCKAVEVYPSGFKPICKNCRERLARLLR